VTVAVFIYRKPFSHLFSAVGYGVIGSRERAEESLAAAGSTARQNTVDAATVGVPGFAGYRAARWARRNPGQAAALAAGAATAGTAGALAGAAAGSGTDRSSGSGGQAANGSGARGDGADADATSQAGSGSRTRAAGRGRGGAAGGNGAGRTPPPLKLPPRKGDSGPPSASSWARGGTDPARSRGPGTAPRPARSSAPPRPAGGAGSPAPRAQAPGQAAPSLWGSGGSLTRSPGQNAARDRPPPWPASPGRAAPASPPEQPGGEGPARPFWLRPIRRRK